jgi:hypothetical protein
MLGLATVQIKGLLKKTNLVLSEILSYKVLVGSLIFSNGYVLGSLSVISKDHVSLAVGEYFSALAMHSIVHPSALINASVIELENTFPFSFAVLVLAQIFCVIIIN